MALKRCSVLVLLLAVACGGSSSKQVLGSPTPTATSPTSATPSASASASATPEPTSTPPPTSTPTVPPGGPSPTPPPTSSRTLSEADNGTTITVARGTHLTVVLRSTYWTIDPPSAPAVVRQTTAEEHHRAKSGTCAPGVGCGTVTAGFTAVHAGTAFLSAHRDSCGEALRCMPSNSRYRVTITVR